MGVSIFSFPFVTLIESLGWAFVFLFHGIALSTGLGTFPSFGFSAFCFLLGCFFLHLLRLDLLHGLPGLHGCLLACVSAGQAVGLLPTWVCGVSTPE